MKKLVVKKMGAFLVSISMLLSFCFFITKNTMISSNAASDKILQINYSDINKVGMQDVSKVACACYAWAYAKTIVDKSVHYWNEFDKYGGMYGEGGAYSMWNGAKYPYLKVATQANAFYYMYQEIEFGRPVCVFVKSISGGTQSHWVTVVGYTDVFDINNLSASNFLIIDPATYSSLSSPIKLSSKYTLQTEGDLYSLRQLSYGNVSNFESNSPSKPTLTVNEGNDSTPTKFNWTISSNATHYDIRIYDSNHKLIYAVGQCDDGLNFGEYTQYTNTSYSKQLKAGKYYANVAAINNYTGEYKFSDDIFFNVESSSKKMVTVTFIETQQKKSVTVGEKYGELPVLPSDECTGWYCNSSKITPETIVTLEEDHYVYPKYEKAGIIFLDANGGYLPVNYQNVIEGEKYNLPVPRREGYTFGYWKSSPNVQSNPVIENGKTISSSHFEKTYYAHWYENEYTVTFDGNGGTVDWNLEPEVLGRNGNSRKIRFDYAYGCLPYSSHPTSNAMPTADKVGCGFIGWFTSPNGGVEITYDYICKIPANHTLYAHYKEGEGDGWKYYNGILKITKNTADFTWPINGSEIETPWKKYVKDINKVIIEEGVSYIGSKSFYNCINCSEIDLPNTLKNIGSFAFFNCCNLSSITIPENVEFIGEGAFNNCQSIKEVYIPSNVKSLGESSSYPKTQIAFDGCENLSAINVSEDNNNYTSIDGVLFNKQLTVLHQFPQGSEIVDYKVPDTVTIIDFYAFKKSKIQTVQFGKNVNEIGYFVLSECPELEAVTILNQNCKIMDYSFTNYIIDEENVQYIYNGTIFGKKSSTAEEYAEKYNRKFVNIDEDIITTTSTTTTSITTSTTTSTTITTTSKTTTSTATTTKSTTTTTATTTTATTTTTTTATTTTTTSTTTTTTKPTTTTTTTTSTTTSTTTTTMIIVNINKIDSNGTSVIGALLGLSGLDENGETITFAKGDVIFDNDIKIINIVGENIIWFSGDSSVKVKLANGIYTLKEENAPDGYILSDDIVFVVKNGKITINDEEVESINMIDEFIPVTTTTTTTTTATTTNTSTTTSMTTTTPHTTTEPAYLLGDVNEDGSVDSSDASLVLAEYAKIQTGGAGEFTDVQYKAADVNKDDTVDSSDASRILAYYAAISTGKKPTWD